MKMFKIISRRSKVVYLIYYEIENRLIRFWSLEIDLLLTFCYTDFESENAGSIPAGGAIYRGKSSQKSPYLGVNRVLND